MLITETGGFVKNLETGEYDYTQYLKKQIQDLDDDDDRAALKHLDEDAMKDALDSMLIDFQLLVEDHDYDWCDAWEQVSDDYVTQMTDAVNQGIL